MNLQATGTGEIRPSRSLVASYRFVVWRYRLANQGALKVETEPFIRPESS